MYFKIENLSAGQADCFLILLENNVGDQCNILVDGNGQWRNAYKFEDIVKRIAELPKLDYIIVTHVDDDHIGGILKLLNGCMKKIADISTQLEHTVVIYNCITNGNVSYTQAKTFEALLANKRIINSYSQRYENNNGMLKILPLRLRQLRKTVNSQRDAYLTFLSPDRDGVNKVIDDYNAKMPDITSGDPELINKNSITFLLEFAQKKVLFLGDAYMEDIISKYEEIYAEYIEEQNIENEAIWKIDFIKIPHHGAENNNLGLKAFAQKHKCNRFLLTGDKDWTDKRHPAKSLIEELYGNKAEIYTEVDLEKIDVCFKGFGINTEDAIHII